VIQLGKNILAIGELAMAVFDNNYTTWYHGWRKEKIINERIEPPCVKPAKKREVPTVKEPPAPEVTPKKKDKMNKNVELVWIMQPCNHDDLRHNIPVPRNKFLYFHPPPKLDFALQPTETVLPKWGKKWAKPPCDSVMSTRCEDWSSLREMLPSRGIPVIRRIPPNCGTGPSSPPDFVFKKIKHFPITSSPMSRYAEAVNRIDRLLLLH